MTTQASDSSTVQRDERRPHSTLIVGGSVLGLGLLAAVALNRAEHHASRLAATRGEAPVPSTTLASLTRELRPSHVFVAASAEEVGRLLLQLEAITDTSGTPASATWRGVIRITPSAGADGEAVPTVCNGDACITVS